MIGHYLDLLGRGQQQTNFAAQWLANQQRANERAQNRQREAEQRAKADLEALKAQKAAAEAKAASEAKRKETEAREAAEDHADLTALALALVRADVMQQLEAARAQDALNAAIFEAEMEVARIRLFYQHEEEAAILLLM